MEIGLITVLVNFLNFAIFCLKISLISSFCSASYGILSLYSDISSSIMHFLIILPSCLFMDSFYSTLSSFISCSIGSLTPDLRSVYISMSDSLSNLFSSLKLAITFLVPDSVMFLNSVADSLLSGTFETDFFLLFRMLPDCVITAFLSFSLLASRVLIVYLALFNSILDFPSNAFRAASASFAFKV